MDNVLVKAPELVNDHYLRLDVIVYKGQSLRLSFWQRAKSLFAHNFVNAFVCLATSRSAPGYEPFASERTTTIEATTSGQGCVEWNESFSFVVPASESARGDLSLTVMDHHLIRGDVPYSPVFRIDIDELKISKERQFDNRFYRFGMESSLSIGVCLRSLTADVIDMRLSKHLHPKEVETVAKRKAICRDAISKLLGKDISPDKVPVVGILGSGGGFRAMTSVAGSMQGMKDTGVLDCSTYIASLSGSTWYLSNLFCPNLYGEEEPDVDKCAAHLKQCCSKMGPHLFKESAFVKGGYIEQLIRRRDNGLNVSLVDLWGCYLASVFQMAKTGQTDDHKLSQQRQYVETASMPFPLYTAIHVESKIETEIFSEWLEFTPYEYGFARYGCFAQVEDLAARMYKGVVCRRRDEVDIGYLIGLWGSCFGVTLHRVLLNLGQESETWKVLANLMLGYLKRLKADELRPFAAALPNMMRGIARSDDWKWDHTVKEAFRAVTDYIEAEINELKETLLSYSPPLDAENVIPPENEPSMIVLDGGGAFNDPFPPLLRQERRVDVLIVFDDSSEPNQWVNPFGQLVEAAKWAKQRGHKMPKIDPSIFDKNNIVESYVFEDPNNDPECPIVVFFPLCNPDLKKETNEDKPVEGQDEVDPFASCYGTFNLNAYDAKQFDGLSDLCRRNVRRGFEKIKQAIARKANF